MYYIRYTRRELALIQQLKDHYKHDKLMIQAIHISCPLHVALSKRASCSKNTESWTFNPNHVQHLTSETKYGIEFIQVIKAKEFVVTLLLWVREMMEWN